MLERVDGKNYEHYSSIELNSKYYNPSSIDSDTKFLHIRGAPTHKRIMHLLKHLENLEILRVTPSHKMQLNSKTIDAAQRRGVRVVIGRSVEVERVWQPKSTRDKLYRDKLIQGKEYEDKLAREMLSFLLSYGYEPAEVLATYFDFEGWAEGEDLSFATVAADFGYSGVEPVQIRVRSLLGMFYSDYLLLENEKAARERHKRAYNSFLAQSRAETRKQAHREEFGVVMHSDRELLHESATGQAGSFDHTKQKRVLSVGMRIMLYRKRGYFKLLKEEEAQTLELRYIKRRSLEESAAELGLSTNRVRKISRVAQRKLYFHFSRERVRRIKKSVAESLERASAQEESSGWQLPSVVISTLRRKPGEYKKIVREMDLEPDAQSALESALEEAGVENVL